MKTPTYHTQLKIVVEEAFQLSNIFSKSRQKDCVIARCLYFYLLHQQDYSLIFLSRFSKYHHTSIMYSIARFDEYYKNYPEYRSQIEFAMSEADAIKNPKKNKTLRPPSHILF